MNTVIVFTAKNTKKIFAQGGTGNWKLNNERVKKCDYVVMTANSHHRESMHNLEDHGKAFLVGKISGVAGDAYDDLGHREGGRWVIRISEYAEIDLPNAWGGYQNPVKYVDLSDIDIDPEKLEWKPFPTDQIETFDHDPIPALTIEEAKRGIAKKLGVTPETIEIIIRA